MRVKFLLAYLFLKILQTKLKIMEKGTSVKWKWGQGTAYGKITEVFESPVEKTIKGKKIKRNGSSDNPAFLLEQEDGGKVLKLKSEVSKV